jgi:predicted nucleic acid-binding protein
VRILFDTNVVLDVLLRREPFFRPAAALFTHVERGRIQGVLGATTVTTLHDLATKVVGRVEARRQIGTLFDLFDVAPVTRTVLADAMTVDLGDFEDAVLHEAARHDGGTGIVTRDARDFAGASLPVYSPPELLDVLAALP